MKSRLFLVVHKSLPAAPNLLIDLAALSLV